MSKENEAFSGLTFHEKFVFVYTDYKLSSLIFGMPRSTEETRENLKEQLAKADVVRVFMQGEIGALKTQRDKLKQQLKVFELDKLQRGSIMVN